MTISEEDKRAWMLFYRDYGEAMLTWSLVESELATLFSFIAKIPPDMAIQLYYSARSFVGRSDLFKASLEASKASDDEKSLCRSIIRKCRRYCECRNKLAHDLPQIDQRRTAKTFGQVIVIDGRGQFQSDALKAKYCNEAITSEDIHRITKHFMDLSLIIKDLWLALPLDAFPSRAASRDRLRTRLQQLPNVLLPRAQSRQREEP